MFGLIVVMTALGLMSGQVPAQGQLRGVVSFVDAAGDGDTYPARLLLHRDTSADGEGSLGSVPDIVVRTDAGGSFRISLPPGDYDVFVSTDAFGPTCTKLTIVSGQETRYDPKVTFHHMWQDSSYVPVPQR